MHLILAIEPDRRQASQLKNLVRTRLGAELMLADTTEAALEAIGSRIPDLVLVPALLSPQDDEALAAALRVIAAAAHVQTLTIPVFAGTRSRARAAQSGGVLAMWRRGRAPEASPEGCDPAVFADQIAAYLAETIAERELAAQEQADLDDRADEMIATPAGSPEPASEAPAPAFEATVAAVDPEPIETFFVEAVAAEPTFVEAVAAEPTFVEAVAAKPTDRAGSIATMNDPIELREPIDPVEARERIEHVEAREPIESYGPVEPIHSSEPREQPAEPFEPLAADAEIEITIELEPEPKYAEMTSLEASEVDLAAFLAELEAVPMGRASTAASIEVTASDAALMEEFAPRPGEAVAAADVSGEPVALAGTVSGDEWVAAVDNQSSVTAAALAEAAAGSDHIAEFELWMTLSIGNRAAWPQLEGVLAEPPPDGALMDEAAPMAISPVERVEIVEPAEVASVPEPPAREPAAREAAQKPERTEWVALVESLRSDIERLRVARAHPSTPTLAKPNPPAAVSEPTPVPAPTTGPAPAESDASPMRKKRRLAKPAVQDEWGFFDPEQCGFAALLAKLDEITEAEESVVSS